MYIVCNIVFYFMCPWKGLFCAAKKWMKGLETPLSFLLERKAQLPALDSCIASFTLNDNEEILGSRS